MPPVTAPQSGQESPPVLAAGIVGYFRVPVLYLHNQAVNSIIWPVCFLFTTRGLGSLYPFLDACLAGQHLSPN